MFTLKVMSRKIIAAGILTAVLIKTEVSWCTCITPCKLVNSYRHTGPLAPEGGGSTLRGTVAVTGRHGVASLKPWIFEITAVGRLRLKCDGTRAETRFRLSAKRNSPFKSAGASVQSTAGSQGVRISGSNAGYTMFRGSVKSTDYPLHSPVSPSLPLPCVTVCHHISTGL
jgi:hypothetical protein